MAYTDACTDTVTSSEVCVVHETAEVAQVVTVAEQGPPGPQGPPGQGADNSLTERLAVGDVHERQIGTSPPWNSAVVMTRLMVDIPFNGVGANATIGTLSNPELLMPLGLAELGIAGGYTVETGALLAPSTPLYLFYTVGTSASTGNATIYIDFSGLIPARP